MNIFKKLYNFGDKLENRVRGHLSQYPIIYSIFGSIFLVILWRGIWHTADLLESQGGVLGFVFHPFVSATWATWGLLLVGLFVSMFVGDMIIMSGLKHGKKASEETADEILKEEAIEDKLLEHIEEHLVHLESRLEKTESGIKHIEQEMK